MKCFKGGDKHKYEPRYREIFNENMLGLEVERISPIDLRKLLYYQEYVYDICAWCGDVVKENK